MLATVALLHGSTLNDSLDSSALDDGSSLDLIAATALVDAVAHLTSTGDTGGADALLRLAITDPDTIAAAHVALHVPGPTTAQHRTHRRTATTTAAPAYPRPLPRPRAARPGRGKQRGLSRDRAARDEYRRPGATASRHRPHRRSERRRGQQRGWWKRRAAAAV